MRRIILAITVIAAALCLTADMAARRTRQGVRQQKQQTERQIAETNRKIKENNASISRRLNQLNLLTAQMSDTRRDIKRLQASVDSIGRESRRLEDSLQAMQQHLELIRGRYKAAVRRAHANRSSMNDMSFIFSAESFTQGYRRYRYIQEYSRWRERKTAEISSTMAEIDSARSSLEIMKQERREHIARLETERRTLASRRDSTSAIVASLKKEGKSLNRLLEQKRQEARKLDAELERLIAEEQRKAAEEAERRRREEQAKAQKSTDKSKSESKPAKKGDKSTAKPPSQPKAGETMPQLSGPFLANKGKLPMPVHGRYTIVSRFGRHKHPELKYVEVDNSGIDIEVAHGTKAHAVFGGRISAIFRQPGYDNIIMIRHGEYLTIYANIASIDVKTGDNVKAGQPLGTISADSNDNNRSILHFEIRREKQKLDPEQWLRQ